MDLAGKATIGDVPGDLVAYRSLRPCDRRLGSFAVPPIPPRKIDRAYGRVVGDLLQHARELDAPGVRLRRLIVVGDNAPSDGAAFTHLCAENGWSGQALIVDEQRDAATESTPVPAENDILTLSHWAQLQNWATTQTVVPVDAATVVLLDIDKTLLGARGRNDGVIDQARATAMRDVLGDILGADFDVEVFERARQTFNTRVFHPLTGDNQDYVAYLCLLVVGSLLQRADLETAAQRGDLPTTERLITQVEAVLPSGDSALRTAHETIAARITAGDPTPFKAFREREYQETIARMGQNMSGTLQVRLEHELFLTGEALAVARQWQAEGALLFALSDKPDEAALPTAELAQHGYRPLHWTPAYIVESRQSAASSQQGV